jgi:hypothetical protein
MVCRGIVRVANCFLSKYDCLQGKLCFLATPGKELELTYLQPGFDRAALFKRNRDYILQALKDRNIDVSRGSKAYGNSWVKGRTSTWRWTHDENEETQSPSARETRPSGSSHAKLSLAQPVSKAAPASSSHSSIPIKTTPAISQIDFDGLGSDPDASPYDVPLPFPVEEWVTDTRERIQGLSRTFRDLARS